MAALRELQSPPGITSLYPRALAGATVLPALRRVPLVGPRLGGGERALPDEELALRSVRVDRDRLFAYDRVCGFRLRDELPPTYPHVLAFPLAMKLMTEPAFPLPAMGLVHVRNRMEVLRPIRLEEELDLRVRAEGLGPHERGTQFEIVAEATVAGRAAWRGRSTYLHRERSGGSGDGRGKTAAPPRPAAVWRVPADIGRRYARVSGDANPIHLHPLPARLLGLPGAIAHGMWTKARCLAALEASLPAAFAVDVSFKLPIVLPASVAFSSRPDGEGRAFAVHDRDGGKPHLAGEAMPA